ncbi:hypothetical protein APHAL10511_001717 [Amanita phalloides]|nr:hypothetical protein APHAL10511_001717 [Amanita phalloides]
MDEKAAASVGVLPIDSYKASRQRRTYGFLIPGVTALILFIWYLSPQAPCWQWHASRETLQLTAKQREDLFLSIPNPESALDVSRVYANHPHLAGSTEDFEDAKTILALFQREFNISVPSTLPLFSAGTTESRNSTLLLTTKDAPASPTAWIDVYYPVLNTPLNHSLDILDVHGQILWSAELEEDGDPLDKEAHQYRNAVPAWHGMSRDGDAVGQLIYANYGAKEDYDNLDAVGTNLTGKIVLTRYGRVYRGLKVKGAEERGAAGVVIYSDPRDDGFVTVSNGYAPYPHGPARNPTSVQRGAVSYISFYPGDPTTPGYPAYENAERQEGTNIPTLPSLPVSWATAQRLLQEIGDLYLDKKNLQGARMLSGKPSENKVRLVNRVDTKVTPIWNTMAAIPGHIRDEVVVIGNHRDAWVMGAADPISGTVSLHEIVRGFGALLRNGWKPLRTIIFASWDAEEHALIGSTEWGEDFASWIPGHVVAYLNVDVSVSGSRFNLKGSPSLAHLIRQSAIDIPHPTKEEKTLWDARMDEGPYTGTEVDEEYMHAYQQDEYAWRSSETGILPLGSGSDYTVFLQRLGVASSDEGFGFTSTDAIYHYHSIYDSQLWQELYGDVGFHRHVAVAKHLGLIGLRIADSIILPLNTTQYAFELDNYLDQVEMLSRELSINITLRGLRKSITKLQNVSIKLDKEKSKAEKRFRKLLRKISRHGHHCHKFYCWIGKLLGLDLGHFTALEARAMSWEDAFDRLWDEFDDNNDNAWSKLVRAAKHVHSLNKKLIAFERGFISEGGIKDREWYKHLGVAPGRWLGYEATTFPALTEALSIEKNASVAQHEAKRITELIDMLCHHIHP